MSPNKGLSDLGTALSVSISWVMWPKGGGGGDHLGFLPNPSMYDILQSVGIFRTGLFIFCQLPLYSVLLFYCLQGISFFEVCLSFPLKSNTTTDTRDVM